MPGPSVYFRIILLFLAVTGCATSPKDIQRMPSYALTDAHETFLGELRSDEGAAHPGKSGFHLLGNGLDGFMAGAVLADVAERSVDVQYYPYHDDLLGRLFSAQMLKAADRGVRVRLLVDDISKASLHAKSFVFDRKQVFIGSLNLDPRSVEHNTEIGVIFTQAEMAAEMGNWFDEHIEKDAFRLELDKDNDGEDKIVWHGFVDGERKTFYADPYATAWERFVSDFMSILPIESQL